MAAVAVALTGGARDRLRRAGESAAGRRTHRVHTVVRRVGDAAPEAHARPDRPRRRRRRDQPAARPARGRGGSSTAAATRRQAAAGGTQGYDRDAFGSDWIDTDHDGCNQRDDVLLRDAVPGTTRVAQQDACDHDVLAGTWHDPYTGRTLRFTDLKDLSQAEAIQIDHVVPLAEAWVSGARRLERRAARDVRQRPARAARRRRARPT